MAATSSSSTSFPASFPLINPIEIDFQAKEAEACRIFIDQTIQQHALNALTEIRNLCTEITNAIHEYNAGNFGYREPIDEKIKTILNNHVAEGNFPFTPVVANLKNLKAFFRPIKRESKLLRKKLFEQETEIENAKKALGKEKNSKLSLLLYDQQEKISSLETILNHFFNTLKVEFADKNPKPAIYFAYAWPTDERRRDEYWVQPFLTRLQDQLTSVGFHTVRLDIVSNRYGANINEFMNKIQKSDYILLFGTESLKDKHDAGLSAVCTEFIEILRKRQLDAKKGSRRVFPILISGSHETAFPPEYERYITVKDWRKGEYLDHFQHLFLELIGLPLKGGVQVTGRFLRESMTAFPAEASRMRTMQEWYSDTRVQIIDSISLEEVLHCPTSLPAEAASSNQSMWSIVIARLKECYLLSQSKVTIFTASEKGEWELRMPINALYTQLAMITEEERKDKRFEVEPNKDNRPMTHETIFKAKKEIGLDEIFTQEKIKNHPQKRALIFGAAGIGKTTFVNYMLYSWAKGTHWSEFQAVFSIRLRNLNEHFYPKFPGHVYGAKDILQREYSSLRADFESLLTDQAFLQNTLLILDGYDELPEDARIEQRHLAQAYKELKDTFPHILISSRPGNVQFNHSVAFEILGFDDEQIPKYISQYFDCMVNDGKLDGCKKEIREQSVNQLMLTQPLAHSLAHIPINLSMLCSLEMDGAPITTMASLYSKMINQFYKTFLVRKGKSIDEVQPLKKPELDPLISGIAKVLEEIATYAMDQETLYVDQENLEEIILPKGVGIAQIRDLGLFKIEGERGQFIHLTFQEYFAARALSRLYLEQKPEALPILQRIKFNPKYALMLQMVAGYLSQRRYQASLQNFFDDLFQEPRDLAKSYELQLFARCFEECESPENIFQYSSFIEDCVTFINRERSSSAFVTLLSCNTKLLHHEKMIQTILSFLINPVDAKEITSALEEILSNGVVIPRILVESLRRIFKNCSSGMVHRFFAGMIERSLVSIFSTIGKNKGEGLAIAIEALVEIVKEASSTYDKVCAAKALIKILPQGSEESAVAVATLIKMAQKTKFGKYSVFAADVLVRIFPKGSEELAQAIAALIEMMRETSWTGHREVSAVEILMNIFPKGSEELAEAIAILMKMVKKTSLNGYGRIHAAEVLIKIFPKGSEELAQVIAALIEMVKETNMSEEIRLSVTQTLITILPEDSKGSAEMIAVLVEMMKKNSLHGYTRLAAAGILIKIFPRDSEESALVMTILIEMVKETGLATNVRLRAIEILREITLQNKEKLALGIPFLLGIAKMKEVNGDVRMLAAEVLKKIIPQDNEGLALGIPVLEEMVKEISLSEETRAHVVETLVRIFQQSNEEFVMIAALVEILKENNNKNGFFDKSAAEILEKIVQKEEPLPTNILQLLVDAHATENRDIKNLIESILSKIPLRSLGQTANQLDGLQLIIQICYMTRRAFIVNSGKIYLSDQRESISVSYPNELVHQH